MEWIKVCDLLMNMDRGLTWQMWRGREPSISSQLYSGNLFFRALLACAIYIATNFLFFKKKKKKKRYMSSWSWPTRTKNLNMGTKSELQVDRVQWLLYLRVNITLLVEKKFILVEKKKEKKKKKHPHTIIFKSNA